MDQAYGGTGSSRYRIVTALQMCVRGFAFAIDGERVNAILERVERLANQRDNFSSMGPRKSTAGFRIQDHGYLPRPLATVAGPIGLIINLLRAFLAPEADMGRFFVICTFSAPK